MGGGAVYTSAATWKLLSPNASRERRPGSLRLSSAAGHHRYRVVRAPPPLPVPEPDLLDGARIVGAGLALGFGRALQTGSYIQPQLLDPRALDPTVIGTAGLILAVVALAAVSIPARCAANVRRYANRETDLMFRIVRFRCHRALIADALKVLGADRPPGRPSAGQG